MTNGNEMLKVVYQNKPIHNYLYTGRQFQGRISRKIKNTFVAVKLCV